MSNLPTIANNRGPMKRPSLYTEFILWSAMPEMEKTKLGLEDQKSFAEHHHVAESTLSRWKERPDFEERVDKILKAWAIGKTPTVVHGIYRAAVKGNPMSQMLWLQYFKGFNAKGDNTNERPVMGGVGDLKHLIDLLPKEMKEKHYGYLRELLDDVSSFRNARDGEDDGWYARPPQPVLDEADIDAQSVSSTERSDVLACRYTDRVCEDLVGQVSTNNNQSTAWWREK